MFLCWIYFLPYYGVTSSLFVFRILDPSATGIDTLLIRCKAFGHILTNQRLCSHDISRRTQKSVQTDPHYPMSARSNLLCTSHSGVGIIPSINSQHPSATVATARTDPSWCLQLHAWRGSGMPCAREAFQVVLPLVLSHITIVFSGSLWVQLEDLLYLMQHTIDWTLCLTYSAIYQMHSDQWHGWVEYTLISPYWLEITSDQLYSSLHSLTLVMNNQIKCHFGVYNEETRWWLWFTNTISFINTNTLYSTTDLWATCDVC